jgi:HD-like signal output (HDOD) protein
MAVQDLRERLQSVKNLPALPTTVMRLIRGLGGGGLSAEELEAIVKTDEAISAVVLRMANSASQGQTGRAFNLHESVARLGSRTLQKIAVAQQCQAALTKRDSGFGLSRGQIWAGALGGGLAAELFARRGGQTDPGIAFVGGLLRDIGKLAMDEMIGAGPLKKAFASAVPGQTEVAVELQAFAMEHAQVGAELANLWGLPEPIQEAIRHHHDPDSAPEAHQLLADVVHCADAMTAWMGLGVGHPDLLSPMSPRARGQVGLDAETAESYMVTVKHSLDQITGG